MTSRRAHAIAAAAAAAVLATVAGRADAGIPDVENVFLNPATGTWTAPTNWSYGAVPTLADNVGIAQGTATVGGADAAQAALVEINGTGGLEVTGGTLTSMLDIRAGYAAGDAAAFVQSGGDVRIMNRGGLWAGNAGTGTITLSGGTTTVGSRLFFGNDYGDVIVGNGATGNGTLNLNGGTLTSYALALVGRSGGTGTINMTAGAWNVGGNFGHGSVTGTTVINQSGGTINVGTYFSYPRSSATVLGSFGLGLNTSTASSYTMSGSAELNINAHFYVGGGGGTNPLTNANNFGFADVVMDGGTINLGNENNRTGILYVGNPTTTRHSGGTVTLNHASATINAPAGVVLGQRLSTGVGTGTGTLTINAGQVLLPTGTLTIGQVTGTQGGNGTVNLAGGRLQAGSINWLKASTGTQTQVFNWTGGDLEVNAAQTAYVLTNSGGTLRPGTTAAPAAFTLTGPEGSYTQTAAGTLALDLAGEHAYDSVNAAGGGVGAVDLAGTVNVTPGAGYAPEFGASFPVIVAKTLSDTATWNLPTLPAGLAWDQRVISEGGAQIKSISVAPASSTPLAAGSWTGPGAVGASYALAGAGGSVSVDANVTAGYLQVGGTGNWSIDGANTLTFSASSGRAGLLAYGNTTTVNAPISFAADGAIGTATAGTKVTLNGTVAGSGTISKTGPGTLELKHAASPFAGTWAISGGALNIDSDANLGAAGATLRIADATVNVSGAWNSARAIEVRGTSGMTVNAAGDASLAGVISGAGGLTKAGTGTLTIAAANTYTGATTVNAGTLSAGAANAIPAASPVVLASGTTLHLNGHAQSLASLAIAGSNPATVTTGGADLSIGGDNTDTLFRGNIDGGGGGTFTKTGTGIFQISGVAAPMGSLDPNRSINTGSIVVQGGILQVNNLARNLLALPNGDITVNAGASLSLGGTGVGGFITNVIAGAGGLQFHGGTVELAADNTYTGPTELRFGSTVVLDTMGALGGPGSAVYAKPVTTAFSNGNTIRFALDGTFSKPIVLEAPAAITLNADLYSVTQDQPVSGEGQITYGGGTITVAANNTNDGPTLVHPAAATAKLGVENAFTSKQYTLVNGTLDLNGFNQTVGSLIGLNTGKIILSTGKTLTTGADNRDSNGISSSYSGGYAGVLTGEGGLTKIGGGLALMTPKYDAAALPFTGPTRVQGGALRWDGDVRTLNATSGITIDAGAALITSFTTAASGGVSPVLDVTLTGGGAFQKNSLDDLELTAVNTYTGGTRIRGGYLILNADSGLGAAPASPSPINISFHGGGAIRLKSQFDFAPNRGVQLLAGGGKIDTNGFDSTLAGPIAGVGGFTKQGGGTLSINGVNSGGTLAVDTGTLKVLPQAPAAPASRANALTLAAGTKLDLANNKLVLNTGSIGAATTASGNTRLYDGLQGLVQSAKNGDAWDGNGLTSSVAASEGGLTTIGIANGAQAKGGIGDTETAVWAGQTVTGSSILAMYTYAGDANLDGAITGDDYSAIDFGILFEGTSGYANGDFNYDGFVTGDDYSVIDLNILLQGPQIPTGGVAVGADAATGLAGVTAVPEPTSLSLLALGAAGLLRRRRRHA